MEGAIEMRVTPEDSLPRKPLVGEERLETIAEPTYRDIEHNWEDSRRPLRTWMKHLIPPGRMENTEHSLMDIRCMQQVGSDGSSAVVEPLQDT